MALQNDLVGERREVRIGGRGKKAFVTFRDTLMILEFGKFSSFFFPPKR